MSSLAIAARYFSEGREPEGYSLIKNQSAEIKDLIYQKLWENAGKPNYWKWGELAWINTPQALTFKTVGVQEKQQAVLDAEKELRKPLFLGKSELDIIGEQEALKTFAEKIRAKQDDYTRVSRLEKNKSYCTYSFPYDKALVPLSGSRFINASYIFGKTQIHSQFPRSDITGEHWEMLYEQSVVVAVMLPQVGIEGRDDVERSFLYLPDELEKTNTYGVVKVKLTGKAEIKDHPLIRRTVSVKPEGKPEHTLHHLQFLGWVDNDVCAVKTAIRACKEIQALQGLKKEPINVHCMAGVGRTGTFGTIYDLYDDAWKGLRVDIFAAVKNQRDPETGRTPYQVAMAKQYRFIYECLESVRLEGDKVRKKMARHFNRGNEARGFLYFNEAPPRWRLRVYGALYEVMGKPAKVPVNYGRLAFHNVEGHSAPSAKKAEAISSLTVVVIHRKEKIEEKLDN